MLRDAPRNPLLVQVLSLYLLLLAFFVVLNTISRVEEARLKAVSGSLNETFAAVGLPADETLRITSNEGEILQDAAFLKRLGSLIKTELAIAEVSELSLGRTLEVVVSTSALYVADQAAIAPEHRQLIDDVAKAVRTPPRDLRYDVEILLGSDPGNELAVSRAAYLADVFAAAGVQKRSLLAGLERGRSGDLRLRFHVRPIREGSYRFFARPSR